MIFFDGGNIVLFVCYENGKAKGRIAAIHNQDHIRIHGDRYKRTFENGTRHGYHRAELSWILESNEMMNRVLLHINARRTKTYQILEKKI